jgi:hypothetical protein
VIKELKSKKVHVKFFETKCRWRKFIHQRNNERNKSKESSLSKVNLVQLKQME